MAVIPLNRMDRGESGRIVGILGGHGIVRRMESMNIRVGKRITKLSSIFRRGPITIGLDNTRVAFGFGMASKILVEVQDR